jgi:hypothetical protein
VFICAIRVSLQLGSQQLSRLVQEAVGRHVQCLQPSLAIREQSFLHLRPEHISRRAGTGFPDERVVLRVVDWLERFAEGVPGIDGVRDDVRWQMSR